MGTSQQIVFILLDALRQDHLSCYGYPSKTSPNIDDISKNSKIFQSAWSPGSSTPESLPRIFTGNPNTPPILDSLPADKYSREAENFLVKTKLIFVLPAKLSTLAIGGYKRFRMYFKKKEFMVYDAVKESLVPEIQKSNITGGFGANPFLHFGFSKGFDEFEIFSDISPRVITKRGLEFIERYSDMPFFLYLHYMQPHAPYYGLSGRKLKEYIITLKYKRLSHDKKKNILEKIVKAYDRNIEYVDKKLKPLLEYCKENKIKLIITSDHGEEFLEYGDIGHPIGKNVDVLRKVPLIVYDPKNPKREVIKKRYYTYNIFKDILMKRI